MGELIKRTKERIKENYEIAALSCIYIAGLLFFLVLPYSWLDGKGAVWISDNTLPSFRSVSNKALLIFLVVLVPVSLFGRVRVFAAYGMVIASFIVALTLSVLSFLQAYVVMQVPASSAGRVLFGVFAVPVAIVGALFHRDWSTLGELLFLLIFVLAILVLGFWLLKNARTSVPL
jgi:hypothetical protein